MRKTREAGNSWPAQCLTESPVTQVVDRESNWAAQATRDDHRVALHQLDHRSEERLERTPGGYRL